MTNLSFEQLSALDESAIRELSDGYLDGFRGYPEPQPDGNRPIAYIHGWWCGAVDNGFKDKPQWMAELARRYVAQNGN